MVGLNLKLRHECFLSRRFHVTINHPVRRRYIGIGNSVPGVINGPPSSWGIWHVVSRRCIGKGNPVSGDITGPPSSWGIWIRGPGPPGWGSLESETVKCGHESCGTGNWQWLLWRGPGTVVNDRPVLSSERMLHKDYNRKCWVGVSLKGLGAKRNWLAVNRQS
jgi:hypothetical protein